tara:strand:- start:719 stop:1219 length:501 start_codon:yes stop_codon:yes gene_type:complete
MSKTLDKRQMIVGLLEAYILANGLTGIGIRELAKAAGTSDRMLLYYFETRDELIDAIFMSIANNMEVQLSLLLGEHKRTASVLLEELTMMGRSQEFMPSIRLWFELLGLAARGQEPYRSNATRIGRNWLRWIEGKLEKRQVHQAEELFATLEGRFLLHLIGVKTNE